MNGFAHIMKRGLASAALVLIAATILVACYLLLPRLVAGYYIAQVSNPDPQTSRDSFGRLVWMGRWATPSLIDAALDHDTEFNAAWTEPCPDSFSASEWLVYLGTLRRGSFTDRRADFMAIPLLRIWEAGELPESDQRKLVRYLYRPAISSPRKWYGLDSSELCVEVAETTWIPAFDGKSSLSLKRRLTVIVDGDEHHPAIKTDTGRWQATTGGTFAGQAPVGQHPLRVANIGSSGGGRNCVLDVSLLGAGKHTVAASVDVGPFDASNDPPVSDIDPPWYEQFDVSPIEFEIGDVTSPQRVDDPTIDRAMYAALDQWKLSVVRDGPTKLRFTPSSPTGMLPVPLAGELQLTVNRKWGGPDVLWRVKAETQLPELALPLPTMLMLNPSRYVLTIKFMATRDVALRTGLDRYWLGGYEFPSVEVEIDDGGSVSTVPSARDPRHE